MVFITTAEGKLRWHHWMNLLKLNGLHSQNIFWSLKWAVSHGYSPIFFFLLFEEKQNKSFVFLTYTCTFHFLTYYAWKTWKTFRTINFCLCRIFPIKSHYSLWVTFLKRSRNSQACKPKRNSGICEAQAGELAWVWG